MLRILLFIALFYMVFNLVRQLLVGRQLGGTKPRRSQGRSGKGTPHFDHIQDADFEEIDEEDSKR